MLNYRIKTLIKKFFSSFGYKLERISPENSQFAPCAQPYIENMEVGPVNWVEKKKRIEQGGDLEWPNMIALNRTAVTLLGSARNIAEIGGGTGCFAYEAAADPKRYIVCSDSDAEVISWARTHRSRHNIRYLDHMITDADGPFDVVVAIDVIEHIQDYRNFLKTCVQLSPRAILTTPNKNRNPNSALAAPPEYYQHVREWTAGEFYWVLRCFYNTIKLYAMPNVYVPECVPIPITSHMTPLIAVCENPY